MTYMPVMLNVQKVRVVIIGGGRVGYRKAKSISEYCDDIIVVSTVFIKQFLDMKVNRIKLTISKEKDIERFLDNNSIVIIATNNKSINDIVERVCLRRRLLFNKVDERTSPFIFPASFNNNGLVVSVSTMGKSPSLSKFLRDVLKGETQKYAEALPVLERIRGLKEFAEISDKRSIFIDILHDSEFWKFISEGKYQEAFEQGVRKIERSS